MLTRRHYSRRALWLLMLPLLFSLSCRQEPDAPLRIGLYPWPPCAYVYLAQELGYLQEEGCNVRLLSFSSLADVQRAYKRNQLHGMFGTTIEFLQIRDLKAHQPQIVQITDFSQGGDVLLGQSDMHSLQGLRGAKVGCELDCVSLYLLIRALQQAGMTLDDIELVSCDQYQIEQMFQAGNLDAVVTYPPVSSRLLGEDDVRTLFSSRELPKEIIDTLFIEESVVRGRTCEIAGMMRAVDRAIAFSEAHPEQSYRLMSRFLLLSANEVQDSLKDDLQVVRLEGQAECLQSDWLQEMLHRSAVVLAKNGQIGAGIDLADSISEVPAQQASEGLPMSTRQQGAQQP